jgi:large subunit ribosomal protein L31
VAPERKAKFTLAKPRRARYQPALNSEITMAKASTTAHPDYHTITIVMTDGSRFETRSTYGKEGDVLTLDVDPKTHPAWVGGVNLRKTGRLESFNNRFSGINFDSAKKAASDVKKPEKKAEKKGEATA